LDNQNLDITSAVNPAIKFAAKLHRRRERDRHGLTIIEGLAEISAALSSGTVFREVYYCPENIESGDQELLLERLKKAAPCRSISARAYRKLAYRGGTGGFAAVLEKPSSSLAELPTDTRPLYLVADSIEKPGNLGAMLRSADGAGASGMIVSDRRTDLFNPNVIRASLGSVFSVPTASAGTEDTIGFLKERGIRIIITSPEAAVLYTDADMTGPAAVVIGSEHAGLSKLWFSESDEAVRIPMLGRADSLNASVSAALLLYEALRQRGSSG
jgi:TrmH family RNA methyltransferase